MSAVESVLTNRRAVAATAAVLFLVVFVLRFASDDPANGIAFLFVAPIVLLSITFGRWGGATSVAASLGLIGVWDLVAGADLSPVSYLVRGAVFCSPPPRPSRSGA